MSEKCVVTIRVMLDTDTPYQARQMAAQIQDELRETVDGIEHHFVLDTELDAAIGFHGGRSFMYREVPTGGEA